jgi:hypothetical protein
LRGAVRAIFRCARRAGASERPSPHFSHPSYCGRRYARRSAPPVRVAFQLRGQYRGMPSWHARPTQCVGPLDPAQRTVEYVIAVSQSARRATTASRRPRYGAV